MSHILKHAAVAVQLILGATVLITGCGVALAALLATHKVHIAVTLGTFAFGALLIASGGLPLRQFLRGNCGKPCD